MSLLYSPRPFTQESKRQAIEELLEHMVHDRDFYLLLIGAALLAAGGIFLDSVPVLIASMIVAPLVYPILGLGLGIASKDLGLMQRGLVMLITGCAVAVVVAIITTVAFGHVRVENIFISFSPNRYLATGIAMVAGCIAAYGLMRPKVGSAITGVAIAVSLMPPLVATGVELTSGNVTLGEDALVLFLLNVVGILFASSIVFVLFGVGREYHLIKK
jgi:uncharacterized hydrophobic protein (TIGR00271 family)